MFSKARSLRRGIIHANEQPSDKSVRPLIKDVFLLMLKKIFRPHFISFDTIY